MIARIEELETNLQSRCRYFKKFALSDVVKSEEDVPIIINNLLISILKLSMGTASNLRTASREELITKLDLIAVTSSNRQPVSLSDSKI